MNYDYIYMPVLLSLLSPSTLLKENRKKWVFNFVLSGLFFCSSKYEVFHTPFSFPNVTV